MNFFGENDNSGSVFASSIFTKPKTFEKKPQPLKQEFSKTEYSKSRGRGNIIPSTQLRSSTNNIQNPQYNNIQYQQYPNQVLIQPHSQFIPRGKNSIRGRGQIHYNPHNEYIPPEYQHISRGGFQGRIKQTYINPGTEYQGFPNTQHFESKEELNTYLPNRGGFKGRVKQTYIKPDVIQYPVQDESTFKNIPKIQSKLGVQKSPNFLRGIQPENGVEYLQEAPKKTFKNEEKRDISTPKKQTQRGGIKKNVQRENTKVTKQVSKETKPIKNITLQSIKKSQLKPQIEEVNSASLGHNIFFSLNIFFYTSPLCLFFWS